MGDFNESFKVLVVDDEPDVEVMFRQRMRRDIRSGRYEFVFARSGVHALEVLAEHPAGMTPRTSGLPRLDNVQPSGRPKQGSET